MIFIFMEKKIIESSKTISEAIKNVYGYDNGRTRKKFFDFINVNAIDISHLQKKLSKYKKVIKKCPVCEKQFVTVVSHRDEKTTCSYSCSNTFFRSGENNPNWGSSGNVLERNGYRRIGFDYHKKECIICGESKIVAIHHYDCNRKNNSPENLIPLCPTHHHYIHSKFKNEIIDKVEEYRNNFIKSL
jgi:hypothetical protein